MKEIFTKTIPLFGRSYFILASLLFTLAGADGVRADTLYFFHAISPNNFSWFSAGNWFTYNGSGYIHANRIPVPTDSVVIPGTETVNAAANTINLVTLDLEYNASVSGGSFVVSTLSMHGGQNGNVTIFTGSAIEVLSEMDIYGGNCSINSSSLTIDKGATGLIGNGGTGQLTLGSSVLYNVGQIVLYPNSDSFLEGGTNVFNYSGAVISGSSNAVLGITGTLDNSGTIRSDIGTVTVSATTWTSTNGIGKFKTALTNAALLFSSGMTLPTNVTFVFSGPGSSQFPNGATIQGVAQVGVYDTNLAAWDNGTLQFAGTLAGAGVVHVAAAPGFPSEMDWGSSSILNGPTVNVDAGGILTFAAVGSTGCQILSGTVNSSGTTQWKSGTSGLSFASPGVFNNLAGALFDCQITNTSVDGTVVGNGLINNAGTFRKSNGTHAITFGASGPNFNNSGLLDVQNGQVQLSRGSNSGTFNMAPGTEIWFSGNTNTFVPGAQVTGTNFLRVNQAGNLFLATNITVANIQLNTAGVVDGPGNLTVTNLFSWLAGTLQGGGAVNIPAGAVLRADTGYFSNYGIITNRTINNSGSLISTNGYMLTYGATVINNLGGGLLEIDNNGGFSFPNPLPMPRPVLNNYGTVTDLSPVTAPLAFAITNSGLFQILTNRVNCYQYCQLAGTTLLLTNTTLNLADSPAIPLTLTDGTLNTAGTIQASVLNTGGTIILGSTPAYFNFTGSSSTYTQTAGGTLCLKIGGNNVATQYDQLNTGNGALGGTVQVTFLNGFTPTLGDQFRVLASPYGGNYTGKFNQFQGVHTTNGLVLVPAYVGWGGYAEMILVAVKDPTLAAVSHGTNQIIFNYPSMAGFTNSIPFLFTNVVEYTGSLNPANWLPLVTNAGTGNPVWVSNTLAATNRFYRIRFQ